MFSSSVGRVGRSAHSLSLPVFTLKGCCPARTSTTSSYRALPCRSHQRRHSSSKPSSPSDGPRRLAQQEGAPAAASTRAKVDSEKRSTGRVGRRKAKDVAAEATIKGKDEALINLPSVPSTHHLHPAGKTLVPLWLVVYSLLLMEPCRRCRISLLLPPPAHLRDVLCATVGASRIL